MRHMKEHEEKIKELAIPKNNTKYDRSDNVNAINANEIFDQIKTMANIGVDYKSLAENYLMIHLMLNRIVNNQLAITVDLQERYMQGETKYPYEQIKGLQVVQDLMQKFETFNRNSFAHYNDMFKDLNKVEYLERKGFQAKTSMTAYVKGDIFRIALECDQNTVNDLYYEKYYPKNPYPCSSFDCQIENSYNAFDRGINNAMSKAEKDDYELFENILNLHSHHFNKLIKKLSLGNYDYEKMNKEIEKIWDSKEYEDIDDE